MFLAPPPPLAFGFGSLSMLGWLAAAAAPILIHLWSRRRYREAPWAAIEFLLAAMRKNARRIQLQQWLLLALRTLILLLVGFAVAEPHFERLGFRSASGVRTHRMFVLDGSYSMAYKPAEMTLFGRAKRLIGEIVEQSGQGDGFTLILLSDPPRAVVRRPSFSKADFLAELEIQTLPHTGGDLAATSAIVSDVLGRVKADHPALARHEVYFVTDLGRSTWKDDHEGRDAASQKAFADLARRTDVVVLDLGQDDSRNLAVSRIENLEPFVVAGRDITIEATVRNFGTQPWSQSLVQLVEHNGPANEDAPLEDRRVDVPAGGEVAVSFEHRFDEPGFRVVGVRLGGDLLDVDDKRWLAVDVKSHLRALCVEGRRGAGRNVASALAPAPDRNELVRVDVVPESSLSDLDLDTYDCIFLCNIAQFTRSEAAVLDTYLRHGGGVVFFLGDQVVPDRYNGELTSDRARPDRPRDRSSRVDLLPVIVGELVPEASYWFDPLDYRHRIVAPFRGRENAGLLSTPIYRYFRLAVRPDKPQASVALAFAGGLNASVPSEASGRREPAVTPTAETPTPTPPAPPPDPAIVVAPSHRGRVAVVATAPSLLSIDPRAKTPWTAWPAWPSFLPVVRGLLASAVEGQPAEVNGLVGEPIGQVLPVGTAIGSVEVTRPDGTTHVVRARPDATGVRWAFDDTDTSGVYRANGAADSAGQNVPIPFAVNVDPTESDLTKLPTSALPKQVTVLSTWQGVDATPPAEITEQHRLHRGLLIAALLCLVIESWLSQRMGRGGA